MAGNNVQVYPGDWQRFRDKLRNRAAMMLRVASQLSPPVAIIARAKAEALEDISDIIDDMLTPDPPIGRTPTAG